MSMTRRGALASLAAAGMNAGAASRQPNVILIMSDDQGYGDFGFHGNPILKTPNLDKLAGDSVEFTRFYVSPVCAPTRASLLTGRFHLRSGVHGVTTGRETMRTSEVTLAESLKPAGYRTALIGKWHLGEHYPNVPHGQGFDEFTGFRNGHWTEYWDAPLERNGKPIRAKGYIADYFTDEAIRFVEKNRQSPFFLYLAYNTPHAPYLAPQKHWEEYKSKNIPPQVAAVYAMIANLDENIGRLTTALDRLKLAEDTIVMFLTDNGPNGDRYTGGLRGRKGAVYEGGVRTPFLLRYPAKVKGGRKVEAISGAVDVLPTVLDLCSAKRPDGPALDGRSLKPMLEGKTTKWHDDRALFTHREAARDMSAMWAGAIRTQRYNLVNGNELYDIENDPAESKNLAAAMPDKVRELRDRYESWFKVAADQCRFQRPIIPVGYAEEDPVILPGPQAYLTGGVQYAHKTGFAHEWITNWKSLDDAIHWEIDVVRPGRFEVAARYLCSESEVGSSVRLTAANQTLETKVVRPTSMEPEKHRDLIPRPEVPEMPWGTLKIGMLTLPAGQTRVSLKATAKFNTTIMELESLFLTRLTSHR